MTAHNCLTCQSCETVSTVSHANHINVFSFILKSMLSPNENSILFPNSRLVVFWINGIIFESVALASAMFVEGSIFWDAVGTFNFSLLFLFLRLLFEIVLLFAAGQFELWLLVPRALLPDNSSPFCSLLCSGAVWIRLHPVAIDLVEWLPSSPMGVYFGFWGCFSDLFTFSLGLSNNFSIIHCFCCNCFSKEMILSWRLFVRNL